MPTTPGWPAAAAADAAVRRRSRCVVLVGEGSRADVATPLNSHSHQLLRTQASPSSVPGALICGTSQPLWNSRTPRRGLRSPGVGSRLSFWAKAATCSLPTQTPGKPKRLHSPRQLSKKHDRLSSAQRSPSIIAALVAPELMPRVARPEEVLHPNVSLASRSAVRGHAWTVCIDLPASHRVSTKH